MAQAVGIIDITWKGKEIAVEKGSKVKLGGIQNKPVEWGRGVARSQEFAHSTAECTTVLLKGQRASEVYTIEEGELQIRMDTGQVIVAYDAFMTDRNEITGGEGGKVQLKWAFGNYEEIS